jgi:hypothetical protein
MWLARDRETTVVMSKSLCKVEWDPVIHRMSQVLFASNIAFSRKNGSVTQQELNLFEFAASRVAPTRATTAKIMRRKLLYPGSCRALFDDVPDDVVCQPVSQITPFLRIDLNNKPSLMFAAFVQSSIAFFTH